MRLDERTTGKSSDGISWAEVPWGTHLCHFYETSAELLEVLVPYYAEGLRANDCGVWVTSEPFSVEQACRALAQAVPELDQYLASGQMVILSYEDWHLRRASANTSIVQDDWLAWTEAACGLGFRGLRASGNATSLKNDPWRDLIACEGRLQSAIGDHRMISLCAYPLARCTASELLEVVRVHDCAVARRNGEWESVESTPQERVEQVLHRHAEKTFRESEERFRTMLETSPDAIARLNLDGRILLANHQTALLFGFDSMDQMLAHTRYIFDMLATEDHSRVRAGIRSLANVNIRREAQYCGVRRDGSRFPAEVDVSLERDSAGEPRSMIVVVRDVSERKRAEQKLQAKQSEAVAANQAKSEFLANVSHEIRTPMTAILGFSDLLTSSNLGERERREFLAGIRRNGESLLELINTILEFSRIDADQLTLARASWPLRPLVDDVITELRGMAEKKGLRLAAEFTSPLPETIYTDATRLQQVLVTLVGNALKFTERGEVRVTVGLADANAGALRVGFAVSDTGIGIPAEKLGELFQPFTQVDGSPTRRYGGAGLGLAIARRLAQALGGDIEVASRLGEGSTFTLAIDASPADDVPKPRQILGVTAISSDRANATAALLGSHTSFQR